VKRTSTDNGPLTKDENRVVMGSATGAYPYKKGYREGGKTD
jgi:hypothetical protein